MWSFLLNGGLDASRFELLKKIEKHLEDNYIKGICTKINFFDFMLV